MPAPRHEVRDLAAHTADQASDAIDRGMSLFPDLCDKHEIAMRCAGMAIGKVVVPHSLLRGIGLEAARQEIVQMLIQVPLVGNGAGGKSPGLDTAATAKEE